MSIFVMVAKNEIIIGFWSTAHTKVACEAVSNINDELETRTFIRWDGKEKVCLGTGRA